MIETTFMRLSKAADVLGTDEDFLLIAATESRVRLHWLLNRIVHAEKGFYDEPRDPQPDEPPYFWVPEEFAIKHFTYIPLSTTEAAELLKGAATKARASMLSEQTGPNGSYWIPQTGWAIEGGGLTEDDLRVSRNDVFVKQSDVEKIKTQGAAILEQPTNNVSPTHGRDHISDKLATMNQAAVKFWGNADRHDRGTHPENATVASWLEKHRFSATLADKAATIIRPEWVPTGRKPEE